MASDTQRKGRVERALDRNLAVIHELTAAQRAALRAQAHAVDIAEASRDSDAVSRANAVYLPALQAAGLSSNAASSGDIWDQLLADITRPSTSRRDAQES
jgi:hypothetical protein